MLCHTELVYPERESKESIKTVYFIAQYSYSIAVTSSGYHTQKISGTFAA